MNTVKQGSFRTVRQVLEEQGIDLVTQILRDIGQVKEPAARAKLYMGLLEYLEPKAHRTEVNQTAFDMTQFAGMSQEDIEREAKKAWAENVSQ